VSLVNDTKFSSSLNFFKISSGYLVDPLACLKNWFIAGPILTSLPPADIDIPEDSIDALSDIVGQRDMKIL
jgi:hypothetical protein